MRSLNTALTWSAAAAPLRPDRYRCNFPATDGTESWLHRFADAKRAPPHRGKAIDSSEPFVQRVRLPRPNFLFRFNAAKAEIHQLELIEGFLILPLRRQ